IRYRLRITIKYIVVIEIGCGRDVGAQFKSDKALVLGGVESRPILKRRDLDDCASHWQHPSFQELREVWLDILGQRGPLVEQDIKVGLGKVEQLRKPRMQIGKKDSI